MHAAILLLSLTAGADYGPFAAPPTSYTPFAPAPFTPRPSVQPVTGPCGVCTPGNDCGCLTTGVCDCSHASVRTVCEGGVCRVVPAPTQQYVPQYAPAVTYSQPAYYSQPAPARVVQTPQYVQQPVRTVAYSQPAFRQPQPTYYAPPIQRAAPVAYYSQPVYRQQPATYYQTSVCGPGGCQPATTQRSGPIRRLFGR